jgi:hypothetical protein
MIMKKQALITLLLYEAGFILAFGRLDNLKE